MAEKINCWAEASKEDQSTFPAKSLGVREAGRVDQHVRKVLLTLVTHTKMKERADADCVRAD